MPPSLRKEECKNIFCKTVRRKVVGLVSRFMDLCAHSVFVYVVDLLVVLVSVA